MFKTALIINAINQKPAHLVDKTQFVEIFKIGFLNSKNILIIALRFLRVKNRFKS